MPPTEFPHFIHSVIQPHICALGEHMLSNFFPMSVGRTCVYDDCVTLYSKRVLQM